MVPKTTVLAAAMFALICAAVIADMISTLSTVAALVIISFASAFI
jgi:hypothetical protein